MRPPSVPIRVALQVLFAIAAVAVGLWALYRLERVVLVLILAMFFAYVIAPLVRLAEHPLRIAGRPRHVARGPAVVLVCLVIAGGAYAGGAIVLPSVTQQLDDAVASAPTYTESFRVWERGWSRYYQRLRMPVELRQGIDRSVLGAGEATLEYARGSLMALVGAASYVPWLVVIPVLAFFLLKDAESFRRTLVKSLPPGIRLPADRLVEELNVTLTAYIRAQLLACVLVGSLCGVGFALLGVPYPVLLGILAGTLEFVPMVGPFVLAVVATIIAALHIPLLAVWTAGFLTVVRVAEDYVIYPRLIGRGIHLPPLAIVIAVLCGMELGGIAGIFIAVPAVALVSVAARHWLEWRRGDATA